MALGKGMIWLWWRATAQTIGRNASKKLWTREELKQHMLSPKMKNKAGSEPRTDFSPIRKNLFKELFQLKFESKWIAPYELAKVSLNNMGNEIRSQERRSNEARSSNDESENVDTQAENLAE
ncbi:uncharacterized protein LOC142339780 [Convolutriloba macropyga]|uniref:uncharacterized protein LOC142339780 n=1 Tax=Convolutriloba macropyga TaxID=536237 RepID=UPI003F52871A